MPQCCLLIHESHERGIEVGWKASATKYPLKRVALASEAVIVGT
jgi:hypothetical protein